MAAEFRKGEPSPEQLPQGEATRLNEGLEMAEDLAAQQAVTEAAAAPAVPDEGPPEGVQFETRRPNLGNLNDEESLLFGPTERPDEPLTFGAGRKAPPPDDLMDWLPYLVAAARDPNAPSEVHELLRSVVSHLGG
jgi:hypothetical protein